MARDQVKFSERRNKKEKFLTVTVVCPVGRPTRPARGTIITRPSIPNCNHNLGRPVRKHISNILLEDTTLGIPIERVINGIGSPLEAVFVEIVESIGREFVDAAVGVVEFVEAEPDGFEAAGVYSGELNVEFVVDGGSGGVRVDHEGRNETATTCNFHGDTGLAVLEERES